MGVSINVKPGKPRTKYIRVMRGRAKRISGRRNVSPAAEKADQSDGE